MWILSWNIQKINFAKANDFAVMIGEVVRNVVKDEPFVLFVLENKTRGDEVVAALGTGLKVPDFRFKAVSTGGSPTLRENIIIIAGNGAAFDEPALFTAWHVPFEIQAAKLHAQERLSAVDEIKRQRLERPTRAVVEATRSDREKAADVDTFRKPGELRNPIAIKIRFGTFAANVLALHAPGPSDGQGHLETTAQIYADAVFQTADGFRMVIGDFNLREESLTVSGFVDQSMLLGATTKGEELGRRHLFSRLDRVYCRAGFPITTMLTSDTVEGRILTDHHCLVVRIDSRPQRRVTDYLQYEPSSRRRQAVGEGPPALGPGPVLMDDD